MASRLAPNRPRSSSAPRIAAHVVVDRHHLPLPVQPVRRARAPGASRTRRARRCGRAAAPTARCRPPRPGPRSPAAGGGRARRSASGTGSPSRTPASGRARARRRTASPPKRQYQSVDARGGRRSTPRCRRPCRRATPPAGRRCRAPGVRARSTSTSRRSSQPGSSSDPALSCATRSVPSAMAPTVGVPAGRRSACAAIRHGSGRSRDQNREENGRGNGREVPDGNRLPSGTPCPPCPARHRTGPPSGPPPEGVRRWASPAQLRAGGPSRSARGCGRTAPPAPAAVAPGCTRARWICGDDRLQRHRVRRAPGHRDQQLELHRRVEVDQRPGLGRRQHGGGAVDRRRPPPPSAAAACWFICAVRPAICACAAAIMPAGGGIEALASRPIFASLLTSLKNPTVSRPGRAG